jgi:ferric-dicitrate binding protein FerR (iron transport regulator)
MEIEKLHIENLIAGYFSDSLTEDEQQELNALLAESDENMALFESMREIWFAAEAGDRTFDRNGAYRRFLDRVGRANRRKRRKKIMRAALQSAAVVAVALVVAHVSFRWGNEDIRERFAEISIEVPLGSRTKTCLPDGSSVWLNAGSRIEYSQGFGVDNRAVSLSGEGYFEVERNAGLPFEVKTAEICVNVLGTKFNFRNYPDDGEASVSLLEGSVSVCNRMKCGEQTRLSPGQKLFIDKSSGEMRVKESKVEHSVEWTAGNLFFDEELLSDIIKELERSYDVRIMVADPDLNNLRFYCSFIRREMSIKDIFDMLCSTGKMTYSISGKEIKLDLPRRDAANEHEY